MAKRDFLYGWFICGLLNISIQEYYGLEGYIAYLRGNWNDFGFPIMATITAVVLLMYLSSMSKTQRIVVEVGMEQVLSLKEGDIVTIERK
jgi:hypothetical protein